jgi:hypothetical protein
VFAEILKGIITHHRGDTLSTPIRIYSDNHLDRTPYILQENDTLYLGIMEPNQKFEDAIIKKVFKSDSRRDDFGNILFTLKSIDTEKLLPGNYYYTLKLKSEDTNGEETIQTLISPTLFWIE